MFIKSNDIEELDKEWIALMQMARKMGISLEEIREFLSRSKQGSNRQDGMRRKTID